jgi:hypothetical protein
MLKAMGDGNSSSPQRTNGRWGGRKLGFIAGFLASAILEVEKAGTPCTHE